MLLLPAIGAEGAEAFEGPDAVAVAVGPVGLEGVVADGLDGVEQERRGSVALGAAAGHASEEVGLAAADGAGAGAAELFERIV